MKVSRVQQLRSAWSVVHERPHLGKGFVVTEAERKRHGEKSAVIVQRLVRVQLRAMGCERLDVGIRREAGEMILREGQGAIDIAEAIKWLRHENAKGAHIYVRPAGTHSLSLIDDLAAEAIGYNGITSLVERSKIH